MEQGYAYDPEFAEERTRLAGMESLWDPGSRALLSELGVGPGRRCLEAGGGGGGGGSMVEWMAGRVAPGGRVLALDVDTRFLEPGSTEDRWCHGVAGRDRRRRPGIGRVDPFGCPAGGGWRPHAAS